VAKNNKKHVTGLSIDKQAGTENTLFATWSFKKPEHFDKFEVKWFYSTSQNVWFEGTTASPTETNSTYSPPNNAVKVYVSVKPVAEKKSGKKDKGPYWNSTAVKSNEYILSEEGLITAPGTPEEPTIDSNGNMTVSVTGYKNEGNSTVDRIEFQIVRDNTVIAATINALLNADMGYASGTAYNLARGGEYKVRCRALGQTKTAKNQYQAGTSEWSDFTSAVSTVPANMTVKPNVEATDETSVRVTLQQISHAKGYEIQYVKDHEEYFRTNPSEVQSVRDDEENTTLVRDITGLDNTDGPTYFFRARAWNDTGDGGWSPIASTVLGTVPDAPTTWSYNTTATIGESVTVNWAHNSEDGSAQTAAKIEFTIGDVVRTESIADDTSSFSFDTTGLSDNDVVKWRVQTKGAAAKYGEWSTVREFTVYAPPQVELGLYDDIEWLWDSFIFETDTIYTALGNGTTLIDTVTKFPFQLYAHATPESQEVVSFAISIVSQESYERIDETGMTAYVYPGDEVFSEIIVPEDGHSMSRMFKPFDIDLENGITYVITVTAAMNSGLSASETLEFTVTWEDDALYPDCNITIGADDIACYLQPFATDEDGNEITNVWLSVYRREYDGRFTEIASNIDGSLRTTLVDPHPALDYARYRVISMSMNTGAVAYYDIPAVPIQHDSIVIQWNEAWAPFDNREELTEYLTERPSTGSILQLPYNIDVSVDSKPDVALVEYIGRQNPVSYYGTQMGETSNWSVEIPKTDVETLYAIRRLAAYMGDVYVREPSGLGYWANITVSYNLQHSKMTIPVSFNITRVEGGI